MKTRRLVESKLFDSFPVEILVKSDDSNIVVQCPHMTTAILSTNILNGLLPSIATDYKVNSYNNKTYYKIIVNGHMIDPETIAKLLNSNEIDTVIKEV